MKTRSLRIPDDIDRALNRLAATKNVSINETIISAIEQEIYRQEGGAEKRLEEIRRIVNLKYETGVEFGPITLSKTAFKVISEVFSPDDAENDLRLIQSKKMKAEELLNQCTQGIENEAERAAWHEYVFKLRGKTCDDDG